VPCSNRKGEHYIEYMISDLPFCKYSHNAVNNANQGLQMSQSRIDAMQCNNELIAYKVRADELCRHFHSRFFSTAPCWSASNDAQNKAEECIKLSQLANKK
jgi:hypothetical protein